LENQNEHEGEAEHDRKYNGGDGGPLPLLAVGAIRQSTIEQQYRNLRAAGADQESNFG
jgi:hypothetical protein